MPQYYFDIDDAGTTSRDALGMTCRNDDDARDKAIRLALDLAHDKAVILDAVPDVGALLRDWLRQSQPRDSCMTRNEHRITVSARDEQDHIVFEASLSLVGRWRPSQSRAGQR